MNFSNFAIIESIRIYPVETFVIFGFGLIVGFLIKHFAKNNDSEGGKK